MVFKKKCHTCGTFGQKWGKEKNVFFCPNCLAIYSDYGVVVDSRKSIEIINFWN